MNVKISHFNIVLFGVKKDTIELYKKFRSDIDLVITLDSSEMKNYHISGGENVSNSVDCECFESNSYKLNSHECVSFFESNNFDLGIVYGWQRLIPQNVLDKFKFGVFGFHASPLGLPFGKGRSPMNWSIILNFNQVYNHCFQYNADPDDGPIYSTTRLDILPWDNINSLREKSIIDAETKIYSLISDYKNGSLLLSHQDMSIPESFFPKRSPKDGEINLSKDTLTIYNLIRGISRPFPGAFILSKLGSKFTIWEAVPFSFELYQDSSYKPGDVLRIFKDKTFLMRTSDGVLHVKDFEIDSVTLLEGANIMEI